MTHPYAEEEQSAQELIAESGTTCLIVRRGAQTGPEYSPVFSPETTETCRAVLLNYKSYEIDGSLILASDRKALVSTHGVSLAPSVDDEIRIGTVDYRIMSVNTLAPANVPVMWTLQLRS